MINYAWACLFYLEKINFIITMKIKFKEGKMPHVTNITFDTSKSKQFMKKFDLKNSPQEKTFFNNQDKKFSFTSFDNPQSQNSEALKTCLLLKFNGFIPKNPNVKSVILANDRQAKPLKSLQSAKHLQRKFPIRKVLTKVTTMGTFFRKDKVFEFQNPQTEMELFQNKSISSSMAKSQLIFYNNKPRIFLDENVKTQTPNTREHKSSFQRYDVRNSLATSSTSLSFRGSQQKSTLFRSKRVSNPVI